MLATFAFDVCHDVYRAAREAIDSKIPTLNAEASGKYQWRPDRMPRLAEYVCDFARAGERALGFDSLLEENKNGRADDSRSLATKGRPASFGAGPSPGTFRTSPSPQTLRTSPSPQTLRTSPSSRTLRTSPSQKTLRTSRLVMFRVYYLGGAEYQLARRHLGISELTWADWAEEIRRRVGRELARAGVFPPSKYFSEATAKAS